MNTPLVNDADLLIRPVEPGDRPAWARLFRAYAQFYKVPMNEDILSRSWSWLMAADHPVEGLLASLPSGELIGLAHYRWVPETLLGRDSGFLDDLLVADEYRGRGVGRRLIAAVAQVAQERGWSTLRWITAHDNVQAQLLYDGMATKTDWVTYELDPVTERTSASS